MLKILSCIAVEHNPIFTALALLVCVSGAIISMRLFARVRRTEGSIKYLWLFLSGLIGGGTVWSTHFVAMLGFQSPLILGYQIVPTVASLLLAIITMTFGLYLASYYKNSPLIETGGLFVGAGIAVMHYVGISAMEIQGHLEWDFRFVVVSLLCAMGFGMAATNRISRPVTRFCKYGGATSLVIAIVLLHFFGMSGMEIVPGAEHGVEKKLASEHLLAAGIVFVMALLLSSAAAAYYIDLCSSRQASERLQDLALQDPTTGLANRESITCSLDMMISDQSDDTGRIAVLVMKLDGLSEIAEVHGHSACNEVLRVISERVGSSLAESELLARLGESEFVLIKRSIYSRREANVVFQTLTEAALEPIDWQEAVLSLKISVGAAFYPDDSNAAGELLERASLAARRSDSDATQLNVYDASVDQDRRLRSVLAADLRHAVRRNELELHYQTQHSTTDRRLVGFEALVRWNHSEKGQISPGLFIPIAEETGLILEIGDWVLREACREAASWRDPQKVAVNVATAQLNLISFPQTVRETLLTTGLPASRLELEITESGVISDQARASHVIRQLKNLGVKIAMDDYGTGYSSLSTLQNFPFDKIKIDQEFIRELPGNKQAAAIVRSTILLGTSLGIPVLAEGVECEEHVVFLKDHGCADLQGYFFSRPMPAEDMRKLVGLKGDEEEPERSGISSDQSPIGASKAA